MARVQLTSAAREDVRDLDGAARKRVLRALKKLEEEPEKRGQPLGSRTDGNLTGFRKLVVGDREFRIIYRVERQEVVVVWVIGSRADDECYHMAVSRLRLYQDDPRLARELEQMIESVWSQR